MMGKAGQATLTSRATAAVLPDFQSPFAFAPLCGMASWRNGMSNLGLLAEREQELLGDAWRATMHMLAGKWVESLATRAIFWINIWQLSWRETRLEIPRGAELHAWASQIAGQHYGDDIILDGYGLIVNPVGSGLQAWHLDYTVDYSTLFIPLTELTSANALEYVDLGDDVSEEAYRLAVRNPDKVDLQPLLESGGTVAVRQLLAPPYSLLKLDFGAIHRGIANGGDRERVVFWISVRRGGSSLPPEPLFQVFDDQAAS